MFNPENGIHLQVVGFFISESSIYFQGVEFSVPKIVYTSRVLTEVSVQKIAYTSKELSFQLRK